MGKEDIANLQSLVLNVVNQKRFSHCRLCLRHLENQFVRYQDLVTLDEAVGEFTPLSVILDQLFKDDQSLEEIPGVDALCPDCVKKTSETVRFLENCKKNNQLLNDVLNNLVDTINVDIDVSDGKQAMYVVVDHEDCKVILLSNSNTDTESINEKIDSNKFECFECSEDFATSDDFKAHNLTWHSQLTCEICHESCSNDVELAYHVQNIHRHGCPHCKERKDTIEQLNVHLNKSHTKYVCKECGVSCVGLDEMQNHIKKHRKCKLNQCAKCGKVYSTKEFYLKHVRLCSRDLLDPHPIRTEIVKNFSCDLCGKAYSSNGGLRVHNRFVHGNAKPHVCEVCGKKFTAPSYLKTHMIKHTGEKNFKCDICGNRFVSKEALLYHTRRHTGEKPYSCKYCNEKFVNASARAEHIKFKHVGPTLLCEICSQKFVTSHFLKQHMNRHRDPTSNLYVSRSLPANMPRFENYKMKLKQ